ncbi:MAG TPA: phosphate acyltransferase [Gemmatimonadaceae bacterium]
MSTSGFVATLRARAARRQARIVFPEAGDPRVQAAVAVLHAERLVQPILVLDPQAQGAPPAVPAGIEVIDPSTDPRRARVREDLLARLASRGLDASEAERRSRDPLLFADNLVCHGDVDGCVAGCATTTADVIRAALWMVGRASGVQTVSSAFYMVTHGFRSTGEGVLTFTDCAVVPRPTATQLADIAVAAVHDRRRIVGDEPVVAFLSFSTHGSAEGESVTRVREAVRLTRVRLPDVAVDGELQADAALIAGIGQRKAPGSAVTQATFTISSTEAPRDRSLHGRARPWTIGPIALASASRSTSL